ncbi:uncharacterized protein LOC128180666 [Crassostrea angulata]|uniref:uncharacterized protein LOC128180666 n=1 Tax=Magallana angulata TaxID=2784310 RepID=UPI0022B13DBA|nr:uncharacterized protein LOC128180666 [Crassostrea angulata]
MTNSKAFAFMWISIRTLEYINIVHGINPCAESFGPSKLHVFQDETTACFWLSFTAKNFTEHQASCRALNGYLAYIPDVDIFSTVRFLLDIYGGAYEEYYLGMTETSGNLLTLEGLPVNFQNFASTQPSSASETCITIYGSSGIYYDTACNSNHFGVCSTIPNSAGVQGTHMQENPPKTTTESPPGNSCPCHCSKIYHPNLNINLTAEEKEEINEMKKNLTVEKSTLSSTIRKFTCAEDDRSSSQTIGVLGACFLAVTFGLVIIVDSIRVINFLSCTRK